MKATLSVSVTVIISSMITITISITITLIHSFILETYIAPLQETTTQRRSQPSHGQKEGLQRDVKFGRRAISKERSSKGRSFHADGPTTEKALRCIIAKRARGTKNSPLAAERSTRRAVKTDTGQQRSRR